MVPCSAALGLPHGLVEWVTMLIVTREGDRRCKLPPHRRALVGLVYLRRHDTLARLAAGFGISVGTAHACTTAVVDLLAGRTPGLLHALTVARTHQIIRICERQSIPVLAHIGAGPWVTTALRRPPGRELTPTQRTVNRALSAARAPVERGIGTTEVVAHLPQGRCSPNRTTSIAAAVLTLERQR